MKEIKLVVIGGGSSYTPELLDGVARRWQSGEFLCREIVLVDTLQGQDRMETVADFSRRMLSKKGTPAVVTTSLDRRKALQGADFVISQIRVGGMRARWLDEHIPLKYGVIGQETTGPGGFANALRTIPVSLEIAQDVASTCPKAWLLNFSNPSGLVTEALLKHSDVKTFGLCNVPIGIKMGLATALSVDVDRLGVSVSGLNHLSFITSVTVDGQDVTSQVFDSPLLELFLESQEFSKDLARFLKKLRIIPASYLRYYWCGEKALASLKQDVDSGKGTRADQVMQIEDGLFRTYSNPSVQDLPPNLKERGGAFYSDVALNAISAIVRNVPAIEALNVVNKGAVPGLCPESVVEVSCVVDGAGPHPLAQRRLPDEVLGLVQRVKAYELLTVDAAVNGDLEKAFFALLNHPLVPGADTALAILRDILKENAAYLPRFSGARL